jgi:undecaprenyl-diphosphatase
VVGWFEAVVLGIVQGLTEFLPISSSAHLRIVAAFSGWPDPGAAFTAVTQIGTETAVIIYFRRDIGRIVRAWTLSLFQPQWRKDPDARMGWYVVVGTLPIGILGFTLQDRIETAFRDLRLIGLTLIVFGVVLGVADALARNAKALDDLTMRDGLLYGLAQSLALVPGVSRSGGTISAGLLLGYRREAAARYAFLLAIPAVLASGFFQLLDIGDAGSPAWGPTIAATLIAFAVGYAVIVFFLRYIATHSFGAFVVYRIALGLLLLALVWLGGLDPEAGAISDGTG